MNEAFVRAQGFLDYLNKISKFGMRYQAIPYQELGRLLGEIQTFEANIPQITDPTTEDELLLSELKIRMAGEARTLDNHLSGSRNDFQKMLSYYEIPQTDLDALLPWLEAHKQETLDSVERLFQESDIKSYELGLPFDLPHVRRQAEEFADVHIKRYHKVIGRRLQNLTKVGHFLRDVEATPTNRDRSYFHQLTNTVAISISDFCYMREDGTLDIKVRELLKVYGHEGMGHALNFVFSRASTLPKIFQMDSALTIASAEAVAQYYQVRIFDDLHDSPETQKELGIAHDYEQIYQEAKDCARIAAYRLRFMQYAIIILADKEMGDPKDPDTIKKRIDLLTKVSLDPNTAIQLVESNRYNYDSEGNLNPEFVSELRYCAQPVKRALEEFAKRGMHYDPLARNIIDATLLRGFWTPNSYVHHARLVAEGKIQIDKE